MKREELIRFAKHLRGWGIEIPSDIMEVSVEEYLSLSPSPQPSATADEKTDHDLSKIADDWATNMPVNTGIRTAFVHGYKYAVKPVAEREVPEEKYPPAPTSHI